jgi:hypothetical protein
MLKGNKTWIIIMDADQIYFLTKKIPPEQRLSSFFNSYVKKETLHNGYIPQCTRT